MTDDWIKSHVTTDGSVWFWSHWSTELARQFPSLSEAISFATSYALLASISIWSGLTSAPLRISGSQKDRAENRQSNFTGRFNYRRLGPLSRSFRGSEGFRTPRRCAATARPSTEHLSASFIRRFDDYLNFTTTVSGYTVIYSRSTEAAMNITNNTSAENTNDQMPRLDETITVVRRPNHPTYFVFRLNSVRHPPNLFILYVSSRIHVNGLETLFLLLYYLAPQSECEKETAPRHTGFEKVVKSSRPDDT